MTENKFRYNISLLLATRGRTDALTRSVESIFNMADQPEKLQLLLAFDRDDEIGKKHFNQTLQPWLDSRNYNYTAMIFEPMGYLKLNVYNNKMAAQASAPWLVIWNDDAIMETRGWDSVILRHTGEFKLLAFHTHRDHPYSIFPILPYEWYELLGYISPHATQDGWLSQQAYMLDIWERIPVDVKHDRYDLTGNNRDDTFLRRSMLEGRPDHPEDFHSIKQQDIRHRDAAKLATYLRNVRGMDMSFFENVFKGTQDPWEKLAKNDVNKQMVQFANPHTHFLKQRANANDI